jgi:hypothetical protein
MNNKEELIFNKMITQYLTRLATLADHEMKKDKVHKWLKKYMKRVVIDLTRDGEIFISILPKNINSSFEFDKSRHELINSK